METGGADLQEAEGDILLKMVIKMCKRQKELKELVGGIENLRDFTKKADGGEVNLTIVRMPDINQSGVESLFKKR